jgi:hypothetical protein
MDKRVKAGIKAGILCGAVIFITLILSFLLCCLGIVGWIIGLAPGILTVHFGKAAIKNGKDVAVSCVVAGIVSPLTFISLLALLFATSQNTLVPGEDLSLLFIISLPFALGISIVEGLLYAKYNLGISLLGQQKMSSGAQPTPYKTYCPRCGNGIDKTCFTCPYCGYDLKDDTQMYDDTTRIY